MWKLGISREYFQKYEILEKVIHIFEEIVEI